MHFRWLLILLSVAILCGKDLREPLEKIGECKWFPGCSTQGATMALEEKSRVRRKSTEVAYVMKVHGLPPGKTYTLWYWKTGTKPAPVISGVGFDESGNPICLPAPEGGSAAKDWCSGKGLNNMVWEVHDFHIAEALKVAVVANDNSAAAYATAYPFPIEAKDGTCHLWLEAIVKDASAFSAFYDGFEPGETVTTRSESGNEVLNHSAIIELKASGKPQGVSILLPGIKGARQGMARYTVSGKACRVSTEYPWGKAGAAVQ